MAENEENDQIIQNPRQNSEDEEDLEDLDNFAEVEVEGIFIKHDFDHIILNDNEVEKFTNG